MCPSCQSNPNGGSPTRVRPLRLPCLRSMLIGSDLLVRNLYPLEKKPGVISLLAGTPNPSTFPITNIQVTVRSPPDADGVVSQEEQTLDISGEPLAAGLQYASTAGWEPFLAWIEGLQRFAHGRAKTDDWSVCVGSGSQDLLYKVCQVFNVSFSYLNCLSRHSMHSLILEIAF